MKPANSFSLDNIGLKLPWLAGSGLMYVEKATHLFHVYLEIPQFLSFTDNFFLECQNYQSLNAVDRKITYTTYHRYCDGSITKGWYRFEGSAGSRMPTACTPDWRCGAAATSWLTNGHPSVADGRVSKQVCFSHAGNCCFGFTININVRNCGNYYVYELVPIGGCSYRYCGTD